MALHILEKRSQQKRAERKYSGRGNMERYSEMRYKDHDPLLFEEVSNLTRDAFNDLYEIFCYDVTRPFDVRHERVREEERLARKRVLSDIEILVLFLEVMCGSNEGEQGVESIPQVYGITIGTVSNYIFHVLFLWISGWHLELPALIL